MPAIADRNSSPFKEVVAAVKSDKRGEIARSNGCCTPQKRRLRSDVVAAKESTVSTPMKLKSPRRRLNSSPNSPANGVKEDFSEKPVKKNWNPRDVEQMRAVKEALHVSTAPSTVVCREDEQKRVLEFCKACVEQEKAGSLYACGCPGTGKSLSMEKVKQQVIDWVTMEGLQPPEVLVMNCTSLANASEIFSKILGKHQAKKKTMGSTSPLQYLQHLYSNNQAPSGSKMILIIADELDYLIMKDRGILHDLFMLTTFPFSRCILIGIANSIDLADRFLPRLQSLNCKPMVVTFRAYSKDQILTILQERLLALPYIVFQQQALELCARKVAAASGDMRKALCVCRSAVEILEAELRESSSNVGLASVEGEYISQQRAPALEIFRSQDNNIVRIDHMALALSKTFRSPIVDTIQSLPQHQQITLCSAAKFFRGGKKDTTVGELNKYYIDICKSALIPPVGILEFLSMCRVLNDQGLFKIGQARDDKLKRVTLRIDGADISFALQVCNSFHYIRTMESPLKPGTHIISSQPRSRSASIHQGDTTPALLLSLKVKRFTLKLQGQGSSAVDQSVKFREASKNGNLVPLYRCIFSDHLTPVIAYRCLVKEDDRYAPSFLFESVEPGLQASELYSVVGGQPSIEIVGKENMVTIINHEEGRRIEEIVEDPMTVPRRIMEGWVPQRVDELLEVFCGGWVGYFSYDTVRYVEKKKLPFGSAPLDDRNLPDVHLGLYDDVIVFDHVEKVRVDQYSSVDEAYNDGMKRLETLVSRVHDIDPPNLPSGSIKLYTGLFGPKLEISSMTSDAYKEAIVLSKRFERRMFADPFEIYKALTIVNPSPYMTYLQARGCILVASCPKILTRVKKVIVIVIQR
ncbi:hypothetical protein REPUB_Repub11eG0151300 [Reevesia pubescens]